MKSQQMYVALLVGCALLHQVQAVVNSGQTKNVEEPNTTGSDTKKNYETSSNPISDEVVESSETAIRREASVSDTYGPPSVQSSGYFNLPTPVYEVPNAPSNNIVYPTPPPDVIPPPPNFFQSSLYGNPNFGKTYGTPQINSHVLRGYSSNISPGSSVYSFNQFSTNLVPPKPIYGPPKNFFGNPGKYNKYPLKNIGLRPPKPVYGTPINFKTTYNYNKGNNNYFNGNGNSFSGLHADSLSSVNAYSNLYSGLSSANHQYGVPIQPPKKSLASIKYGSSSAAELLTQYGVPTKNIQSSILSYGPLQPSPNPKPPHPGAPAPPTPPDIKYDGWQPIPGLVSNRPSEETHITGEGSGYHDLIPPPPNGGRNQLGHSYSNSEITLDVRHNNNLLDGPGLRDSYGVPLNSVTGPKIESDSYSAPLGTVTGSGGTVASSGSEAHRATASVAQTNSHSISQNLDLSSIGIDHGFDVQTIKSLEHEIHANIPTKSNILSTIQLSDSYVPNQPHTSGITFNAGSSHNIESSSHNSENKFASYGHNSASLSDSSIGLTPPSGIYGLPPRNQQANLNNYVSYRQVKRPSVHKDVSSKDFHSSFSNSYLPPTPSLSSSISYGVPNNAGAISYQNVVHGSSTAGIGIQQSELTLDQTNTLLHPTTYNTYGESLNDGHSIGIDYSETSQTNNLGQGKHFSSSHDCILNNQQYQVPSLAYGVPSADSYTSSLPSLTTNIATSQGHSVSDLVPPQQSLALYSDTDLTHSSSVKSEAKVNNIDLSEEAHGKSYGKSVAESFGPNSELVESQSIDLNNIPLQGNLGSYTLQIQSADGLTSQVPHTQVLNDGLLQSILQAIEQPGQQDQNNRYPIILQPSIERNNYLLNETMHGLHDSQSQQSEIREVIVDAPQDGEDKDNISNREDEETLQLLDTSNIALYFKKDGDMQKVESNVKTSETKTEKSND